MRVRLLTETPGEELCNFTVVGETGGFKATYGFKGQVCRVVAKVKSTPLSQASLCFVPYGCAGDNTAPLV